MNWLPLLAKRLFYIFSRTTLAMFCADPELQNEDDLDEEQLRQVGKRALDALNRHSS